MSISKILRVNALVGCLKHLKYWSRNLFLLENIKVMIIQSFMVQAMPSRTVPDHVEKCNSERVFKLQDLELLLLAFSSFILVLNVQAS